MDSSTAIHSNGLHKAHRDQAKREAVLAYLALAALAIVCGIACFAPLDKVDLSDRIALLFLAVTLGIIGWTPCLKLMDAQPGATTFALTAAMFVVYGIARRDVPDDGWSIRFAAMPDDEYVLPYSAYVVGLGALLTLPLWWRHRSDWLRGLLTGFGIIAFFAVFSFWLLSRHFKVGATEALDPSALPNLFLMLIEYGSVAILCRAVSSNTYARRYAMRFLPIALLALWARFHFFGAPAEEAE